VNAVICHLLSIDLAELVHHDTIAAEHEAADDEPAKRTNSNGQDTPEPA
jgi:hypothetical protein